MLMFDDAWGAWLDIMSVNQLVNVGPIASDRQGGWNMFFFHIPDTLDET